MDAHRIPAPPGMTRPTLWVLSFSSVVLAIGAILILVWQPRALLLALGVGFLALASRTVFAKVRSSARVKSEGSSVVANLGLAIAVIVVTPLLAFALLWFSLLVVLGGIWVLHLVHLA